MSTKFMKVLLIIVETLLCLAISTLCIYSLLHTNSTDSFARYAETAFRCIIIYLFSIIFFTSLSQSSGPDSLFIPYFLISFIVSEIRIFSTFAKDFSFVLIPPMTGVTIMIASCLFMCLSLIGYGLLYENRDEISIKRFQMFSFVISIIVAILIPKVPDYYQVLALKPVEIVLTLMIELNALIYLILLFQDDHSSDIIRHLAVFLLIAGNFTNLFFDSYVMNLAATIFTFIGLAIITIIVKISEIKF